MEGHDHKDIEMGSKNLAQKPDSNGQEAEVKGDAPFFRSRKRACRRCCAISCCLLVLLVIVIVILAFTVFKVKKPQVTVESVTLDGFDVNFQILPPKISIDLTLGLLLSVKNPNKVSFRYSNSTANLLYRGEEVGTVPIPPGVIGADGTEEISTTLTLLADRLITNLQLLPDLLSGTLSFSSTTEISGRVTILNIIKRHVNIFTQCDFSIAVKSKSLSNSPPVCTYSTDF